MNRVLVVDDDPSLGELIAEFCRQAGFEARHEPDGVRAVEVAKEWKPTLITLDLEMPGIDGLEVLRRLQTHPDTRRVPVVIISVVGKGALDEGLLEGARMVFEKPLSLHKLVSRLQQLVSPSAKPEAKGPVFEPFLERYLV